jgi:hypothetical protein
LKVENISGLMAGIIRISLQTIEIFPKRRRINDENQLPKKDSFGKSPDSHPEIEQAQQ